VAAEVERRRRILATALANAVNVLNPSIVILGGFLATILDQDAEALESAVREQAMAMNVEDLHLRAAAWARPPARGRGRDRLRRAAHRPPLPLPDAG
jgi:predicted NBD/HSP70 family sugar kinase